MHPYKKSTIISRPMLHFLENIKEFVNDILSGRIFGYNAKRRFVCCARSALFFFCARWYPWYCVLPKKLTLVRRSVTFILSSSLIFWFSFNNFRFLPGRSGLRFPLDLFSFTRTYTTYHVGLRMHHPSRGFLFLRTRQRTYKIPVTEESHSVWK